jgi:probable HAF family extracellular repeat protein
LRRGPLAVELLEVRVVPATITDLGYLSPIAINDSGQVAGATAGGTGHALLYSNGTITDLGTLGGTTSAAAGINSAGDVVGWSYTGKVDPRFNSPIYHGFLYSKGAMTDLGTFMPSGINDSGQIAGNATATDGSAVHAFLYSGGAMTDLGTLGGTESGAGGINNAGEVAGWADTGKVDPSTGLDIFDAFLYRGGMSDLVRTSPLARVNINDAGQVIGTSDVDPAHAYLYSNGATTDLGTLPGFTGSSWAVGINNAGEVVGSSEGAEGFHPFLYRNGVMTDLNDLLPGGSGWVLESALAINNSEQIVGTGWHNGTRAGYLLSLQQAVVHPTSLQWDGKAGGADYTYSVTGTPLPQDAKLSFYWATGPTSTTILGKPIYSVNIGKGTLTVNSALAMVPVNDLASSYTPQAHFLLAVADPTNTLGNFTEAQNVRALAYNPAIGGITATYSIPGNKTLIGRFFQGVPVNGQVFTVTVDNDLAAVRPSPLTLTLPGTAVKLTLKPQAGGDGTTYVSDSFNGTGALKPADYQATVTAQLGGATTATGKIGYDVVAQPKWFTALASAGTKPSFDASAKSYTFALALINLSKSTSQLFELAGAGSTWFAAAAKSGVDAHVTFQVVTGLDPAVQPTFSGKATGSVTVLGQSWKSFDQTYSSLSTGSGPFSAKIDLDPTTLNIKDATFTYDDHGSNDITLTNSHPIVRRPFQFDYEFNVSIDWTANVTIKVKPDGSLGPSSLDFTAKDDDVDGTLTITDVSLLPTAVGKGVGVLNNILDGLKGIPGLLASFAKDHLQDLGLLPNNLRATADVTGSFSLHGHANLQDSPENPTPTGAKFQAPFNFAVPTATIQFDWLGKTRELPTIDLGNFLSLKGNFAL